jgi:hypothetical protein
VTADGAGTLIRGARLFDGQRLRPAGNVRALGQALTFGVTTELDMFSGPNLAADGGRWPQAATTSPTSAASPAHHDHHDTHPHHRLRNKAI